MNNNAIFVDKNDNFIKYGNRNDLNKGDIIRISTLWLENSNGEVLLARRSDDKKYDPGKWGMAATGTLEPDETYESNVYKEAEEEIGITEVTFTPVCKEIFIRQDGVGRACYIYKAIVNKPAKEFILQESEVAEVKWFTKAEIRELIQKSPDMLVGSYISWEKLL